MGLRAAVWVTLTLSLACQTPGWLGGGRDGDLEPARARLRMAVDQERVAGVVALVAYQDDVVLLETLGWADREQRRPMTERTLFRLASMSKPITSVAILKLWESGALELDDPVSKWIPEFADVRVLGPDENGAGTSDRTPREPTIRNLLTHTAGITYRFIGREPHATLYAEAGITDGLTHTPGTVADQTLRLARMPLVHEPGRAWSYGLSTDVLGRVVEVVSGQRFDVYLEEQLFAPLDMVDTYFFVPDEKLDRLAVVYQRDDVGRLFRAPEGEIVDGHLRFSPSVPYAGPRTYLSGGAGLVSTLGDYYRFARMLLGEGELDGVRVLEPETVAEMTRNQIGELAIDGAGNRFGLGVSVQTVRGETRPVGTFGWGGFYNTLFWVDPANQIVGIVMSQHPPGQRASFKGDFLDDVYYALPVSGLDHAAELR